MADCEDNKKLVKMEEVRDCLNFCANKYVTPRREILENEVTKIKDMMNRELDKCIETASAKVQRDDYTPGKKMENFTKKNL